MQYELGILKSSGVDVAIVKAEGTTVATIDVSGAAGSRVLSHVINGVTGDGGSMVMAETGAIVVGSQPTDGGGISYSYVTAKGDGDEATLDS